MRIRTILPGLALTLFCVPYASAQTRPSPTQASLLFGR